MDTEAFAEYLRSLIDFAKKEKGKTFHMPDQRYWQGKIEAYSLVLAKVQGRIWS